MTDWIDSPERAIENASGQVALARALDLGRIELNTEDLAKVVSSVKSDLESAVVEAAVKYRQRKQTSDFYTEAEQDFEVAVDALIADREESSESSSKDRP